MLTNDHEGRVLIEGGSVCDGGWTDVEAGVVCRMLGHAGGHTLPLPSSSIGHLLAEVRCRGWETNIMLCEHTRYHNEDNINDYNDDHARLPGNQECPGGQGDAGVSCYDEPGHGGGDPGAVEDNVITDIRTSSNGFCLVRPRTETRRWWRTGSSVISRTSSSGSGLGHSEEI